MLYRIILTYIMIVLIYFKYHNIKENKFEKFIFSMFIPIAGIIVIIILEKVKFSNKDKKRVVTLKAAIKEDELFSTQIQSSIVDNLLLENYEEVREMVLSAKSLKLKEQCAVYKMAIGSKNVEIAHVAATSLMKTENYFERLFNHIETKLDLNQTQNIKKYIDVLNEYLECNLVYGILKDRYIEKLIHLIEKLEKIESTCELEYYYILIDKYIEIKDYTKATEYIKKTIENYGSNEITYEKLLKINLKKNNFKKFSNILRDIEEKAENNGKLEQVVEFWKRA